MTAPQPRVIAPSLNAPEALYLRRMERAHARLQDPHVTLDAYPEQVFQLHRVIASSYQALTALIGTAHATYQANLLLAAINTERAHAARTAQPNMHPVQPSRPPRAQEKPQ